MKCSNDHVVESDEDYKDEVRNVSFSENFAFLLNEWSPNSA